jgi:hypothetical protein
MAVETQDAALAARTILDAFYRCYREQGLELIGSVDLPATAQRCARLPAPSRIRPRWICTSVKVCR